MATFIKFSEIYFISCFQFFIYIFWSGTTGGEPFYNRLRGGGNRPHGGAPNQNIAF